MGKKRRMMFLLTTGFILSGMMILLQGCSSQGEDSNLSQYVEPANYKAIIAGSEMNVEKQSNREKLWQEIINKSKLTEYPEKNLERAKKRVDDYYHEVAKSYEYKDFSLFIEKILSLNDEKYEKTLEDTAKSQITAKAVLYRIAELEKVQVRDEDYEQYLKKLLLEKGYTKEEFVEVYGCTIEEYGEKKQLREVLLKTKVFEKLFEQTEVDNKGR